MVNLDEMSVLTGFRFLTDQELLRKMLCFYEKPVFKSLIRSQMVLSIVILDCDEKQWQDIVEERFKKIYAEIIELHLVVKSIILNPPKLQALLQHVHFMMHLLKEFVQDDFSLPANYVKKIEMVIASENLIEYDNGVNVQKTLTDILQKIREHAASYKKFMEKMLQATLETLAFCFYQCFTDQRVNFDNASEDDMLKIISGLHGSRLASLISDFEHVCVLSIEMPFLKIFKKIIQKFYSAAELARKINHSLSNCSHISRLLYLQQNLDYFSVYEIGYCDLDLDHWLKEESDYDLKTSIEGAMVSSDQMLLKLNESPPIRHTDAILIQSKVFNGNLYRMGPSFIDYSDDDDSDLGILPFVTKLKSDLDSIVKNGNRFAIKIVIGIFVEKHSHVIGLKKCSKTGKILFRDVNQGLFIADTIDDLFAWLPEYFNSMPPPYLDWAKSYVIQFISPFRLKLPTFLNENYKETYRLLEAVNPVNDLKHLEERFNILETSNLLDKLIFYAEILKMFSQSYSESLKIAFSQVVAGNNAKSSESMVSDIETKHLAEKSENTTITEKVDDDEDFFDMISEQYSKDIKEFDKLYPQETQRLNFVYIMLNALQKFFEINDHPGQLNFVGDLMNEFSKIKGILNSFSKDKISSFYSAIHGNYNFLGKKEGEPQNEKLLLWLLTDFFLVLDFEVMDVIRFARIQKCHELEKIAFSFEEEMMPITTLLFQYGSLQGKPLELVTEYLSRSVATACALR